MKYQARFIYPWLDAFQVAIEARLADYLSELELPVCADYRTPVEISTVFPCMFLAPGGSKIQQSADDSRVMSEHEILIDCALTGPDAYTLARDIGKMALAIDRAVRSTDPGELVAVSETVGPPVWEITDHNYQLRKNDTILRADAQLTLMIQHMEL